MDTDPSPESSGSPEGVDPEIASIQQSLLADDSDSVDEPEAEEAVPPRALGPGMDQLALPAAAEVGVDTAPPTIAGFDAGRVPLRTILLPFVIYDVVWATFAFALARLLVDLPSGTAVYEWYYYEYALWIGVALTALGPLLIVVVWLVIKLSNRQSNGVGLATLLVGSAATLLGVLLWWGALIAVDYLRLGSVY